MSKPIYHGGVEARQVQGTSVSDADVTSGLVLVDRLGILRHWDSVVERLTGHSQHDAIGKTLDLIVPPEFRAMHWSGFRAAMASGILRGQTDRATLPVLCSDETVRSLSVRFHLIRDVDGVPVSVAAVFSAVQPL